MFKKLQPNSLEEAGDVDEQTALLDPSVLDGLRELAGEQHSAIIESFLKFSAGALADIESAIANSDAKSIKDVAHSLKSSSLQLGATKLGHLARDLEAACQASNMDSAQSIVLQIRIVGDQTRAAFFTYIETQKTA